MPSNSYFHKLKLPPVPVRDLNTVLNYPKWTYKGYHIWKYPQLQLSKELLDAFARLGLNPGYTVFFSSTLDASLPKRIVHSDLISKQDPRLVKSLKDIEEWRPSNFGINFEVTGTTNDFYWYELPESKEPLLPVFTEADTSTHWAWLAGQHYGTRDRNGVHEGSRELARTTIGAQPTLVRADVPHSTVYTHNPQYTHRIAASIRFYENWTWEEACELFRPLFEDPEPRA